MITALPATRKNSFKITLLAGAIAIGLCAQAHAAPVPNALRFSVFVSNQGGQPFTGVVDLQLQFFDAPSGGNSTAAALTIEDVAVQNGIGFFVGDFGAVNPISNVDTYIGGGLRLGNSTGAFTGFSGRGRFYPTGFALHAQKIAPGIVGSAEIVPAQVQSRVSAACVPGQAIRQVNQDGSVECQNAGSGTGGGTITSVLAGTALAGGGNTGSVTLGVAPLGISSAELAANSVNSSKVQDGSLVFGDIDANSIQRRVTGSCPSGQALRSINIDGSAVCETFAAGWSLGGNAINNNQFLGTTNSLPLELRTNGSTALRLGSLNDPDGSSYGGPITATSTVAAGSSSNVSSGPGSTAGGGGNGEFPNRAEGRYSTTAGGLGNQAGGDFSLAAGRLALVRNAALSGDANGDEGSMLLADSQNAEFRSSGPNQFAVRAQGGVFFGTDSAVVSLPGGRFINTSTGAFLSRGGTWTNSSSRALKTGFEAVDAGAVLNTLLQLPLMRWRYRSSPDEGQHLGPVAEDFRAAFQLGGDASAISTVDADGVALAAIQGLNAKLEAENRAQDQALAELRAELAVLRAAFQALAPQPAP